MNLPSSLDSAIKRAREKVDLLESSLARLSHVSERLAGLRLAFLDDKESVLSRVALIDEADYATREQITEDCELIVARLEAHCVQLAELEKSQRDMLSRLSSTPAASAVLSSAGQVTIRRDALRRLLLRMEAGPTGDYLRTKGR